MCPLSSLHIYDLMGKNKLQKFADMESYPHVFQYPYSVLENVPFDMKDAILLIPSWQEFLMYKNGKSNDRDILKLIS